MDVNQFFIYGLLVQHFIIAFLIGQLAGQLVGKKKFLSDKLKSMELKVSNDYLLENHMSIGNFVHVIFSELEILIKGGMNKEKRLDMFTWLSRFVAGKHQDLREALLESYVVEQGKNPFLHILQRYIDETDRDTAVLIDLENHSTLEFSNVEHSKALAEICTELLRNICNVSDAMKVLIKLTQEQGILQIHISFKGEEFSFIHERNNPVEEDDNDNEHDTILPEELEYGYEILNFAPVRYLGLDFIDQRLEKLQATMEHSYKGRSNYILIQKNL